MSTKFYKVCAYNTKHTGITESKTKRFNQELLTIKENLSWADAKKLRGTTQGSFIIPQAQFIDVPVEMPVEPSTLATEPNS